MPRTAFRAHPVRRLALPAAVLAALAFSPAPAGAGERISPMAELAIRNLVKSYAEHWPYDRPRSILKHLTEDAVLMPHHGHPPVEGKDAIYSFWWPGEGPKTGVSRFVIEPEEIYGEGDLAYVRGRFELDFWVGMDEARRTFSTEGNWLGIITRNDQGRWLIHRAMWNDPEAAETTGDKQASGE